MIITDLTNALKNSLNGIKLTWNQERAFRQEVIAGACILSFTFWMRGCKAR